MTRDLWDNVCSGLMRGIGRNNFQTWIEPIDFLELRDGVARFAVPTRFFGRAMTAHPQRAGSAGSTPPTAPQSPTARGGARADSPTHPGHRVPKSRSQQGLRGGESSPRAAKRLRLLGDTWFCFKLFFSLFF